jgi:hypothetical protein
VEVQRDRSGGGHGTFDVEEESGEPWGHGAIVVSSSG